MKISRWFSNDIRSTGKWFLLSLLVGVVAGTGAIVFQIGSQAVSRWTAKGLAGLEAGEPEGEHVFGQQGKAPEDDHGDEGGGHEPPNFAILAAVLIVGGLVSGSLVYTFCPEAEGHGTDGAIDAFHHKRGRIGWRVPIVKSLASAITLGTGGSGGREGPIAQIGAGFGSLLGNALHLSSRDRRLLLAAGMGAGVAAIFRAPLAGTIFASEILYSGADFESDVIVPSAMACVVSYLVYSLSLPSEYAYRPLFGEGLDLQLQSAVTFVPLTIMAFALVLVAAFYIRSFYGLHELFAKLPGPRHVRPAIGAGLTAALAYGLHLAVADPDGHLLAVLSTGYGALQTALRDPAEIGMTLLLVIAFGKIATTGFTIGSGGSGGVFGPSMVIGGCVGGAVGLVFHHYWPGAVPDPAIFVILGMAGFFAGAAHAPISTLLMVTELTGSYHLLLPTMWVNILCFVLCRRWKLYRAQLPSRLESPAHRGDFLVDVLQDIRVADVPDSTRTVERVPESMPLEDIVRKLTETEQDYFPVVDDEDRFVGVFTSRDVRRHMLDPTLWRLAIASDVMVTKLVTVTPDNDLSTAFRRFTERNIDELPIVAPDDPHRLVGMLRRREALGFYNQRVLELRQAAAEHG